MQKPILDEMIACAKRELQMRKSAYPKWVDKGTMNAFTAQQEMERMEAIVELLTDIKYNGRTAIINVPTGNQGNLFL